MSQKIKNCRASVLSSETAKFFDNLKITLKYSEEIQVLSWNVFNYDETNLSDNPGTIQCIFKRGVKYPERIKNSSKSATSIMFCGSATGQMGPVYVVYKAEHLWTTWNKGEPPNIRYNRTKSGWFDSVCFSDWFEMVFVTFVKDFPETKVLIGDNLSSHFSEKVHKLALENNILIACLLANSTHLLQPLDAAFYGPLKRYWRKILDQ